MTSKRQDMALVGAGAAACAVCCAGPIVGFLAAIGLSSVLGVAMFGMIGLAVLAGGSDSKALIHSASRLTRCHRNW